MKAWVSYHYCNRNVTIKTPIKYPKCPTPIRSLPFPVTNIRRNPHPPPHTERTSSPSSASPPAAASTRRGTSPRTHPHPDYRTRRHPRGKAVRLHRAGGSHTSSPSAARRRRYPVSSSVLPPPPLHPLGLQDELADLIPLPFLLSRHVLPAEHAAALRTADVADGVGARDELAGDGLVGVGVGEVGQGGVLGFGGVEARPCRPVKPLLMIWEERARSAAQRAQRRWEAWPVRKASVVGGEEEELLEAEVALLSVLDWRRRKGREGTR
ncbi:hypothetical protein KC345_g130 [Hortaea werneckii]|nr:hypothetical protein KC345_g130 [Hortaea werneckii]